MPRKTSEEINAEIVALKAMRPNLLRFSKFGDDHHEAVDAAIAVLEDRMSMDQVHEAWGEDALGDEFDQYILDEVLGTLDWMTGERTDDGSPSGPQWWGSLVREG
jgi:hypothetical protein